MTHFHLWGMVEIGHYSYTRSANKNKFHHQIAILYYLRRRLESGEGIVYVAIGVTQSVCVSAEPRLDAAVVSAAKVMRCIQCTLVLFHFVIFK